MKEPDWKQLVSKYDKHRFLEITRQFPGQFEIFNELNEKTVVDSSKPISNIVICGMGGSGMAGRLIADSLRNEISVPIVIHADYGLPAFANNHSLVIAVSFSGNTEETLSAFTEAKKRNCPIVSICSGEKLSELDSNAIRIPGKIEPRQGTGYLIAAILVALTKAGLIQNADRLLTESRQSLQAKQPGFETQAKALALRLKDKLPILCASPIFSSSSLRWTFQFAENAKTFSHSSPLPEMNHNELNAIPNTKNVHYILLRNPDDSVQMRKRFEFLKKTIGAGNFTELEFFGQTDFEKILLCCHLSDFVSYYLAMLYKRNPTEIPIIEDLKKSLQA